jgi:hypothetical protein
VDRRRRDHRLMSRAFRIAAAATLPASAVVTPPPPAGSWTGTVHTPRMADALVDFWGVDTHFTYSTYTSKGTAAIASLIKQANIRWVRDGVQGGNYAAVASILNTYDLNFWAVHSPEGTLTLANVQAKHDGYKNTLGARLIGIEGWNEPDNGQTFVAGSTIAGQVTQWQTWMWQVYRQSSTTYGSIPIAGPSLADANSATKWGAMNLTAVADMSNHHDYPGNSYAMVDTDFTRFINNGNLMVNKNRRITTETGTTTGTTNGGYLGPDQAGQALVNVRVQWEHFRRGWDKSSTYEMVSQNNNATDFESNFGLLNFDLSPRPAYTATKNTLGLLTDPGSPFTPTPLAMNLTGDSNTRFVVLAKRNGEYWLAVWQQVQVWNAATRTVTPPVNVPVALTFDRSRTVRVYDPYVSTAPVSSTTGGSASIPSTQKTLLVQIV